MGLLRMFILRVLVAALPLVSCAAFTKRYPDPLNCQNYYLRIDDIFEHHTCPNNSVLDQDTEECPLKDCTLPNITPLDGFGCNQNKEGYYCTADRSFTYCTHDGLKILDNAACPSVLFCRGQPNTNPCVHISEPVTA